MSDMEQLISEIKSGKMSRERLLELQAKANTQLSRYDQALIILSKNGESFTFEDYKEALRAGSGGDEGSMSRSEWEQIYLFPEKRLNLRNQLVDTIKQGQENFSKIKIEIEGQLSPKLFGHDQISEVETVYSFASVSSENDIARSIQHNMDLLRYLAEHKDLEMCEQSGMEIPRKAELLESITKMTRDQSTQARLALANIHGEELTGCIRKLKYAPPSLETVKMIEFVIKNSEILTKELIQPANQTQKPVKPGATPLQSTPRPAPVTIAASNKSPFLAGLLSYFLLGGAGQIYLGQWKKGLALMVSTFFLTIVLVGILIPIIGVGDAYGTAKKLSNGHSVGEWEFSINWVASGLVLIIYAVAICGIAFLVLLSSSR
jgi:TM2 domain-containing membrane protein YozV